MTWLRWDVGGARNSLYGSLGDAAGVDRFQAFWHYVATLEGFAEYRPSGDLDGVTNDTLEMWAGWTGKSGRWARAFRGRCRSDDGLVRGWHRNAKLVAAQEAGRRKARERMQKFRESSRHVRPEHLRTNVDGDVDGTTTPSRLNNSVHGAGAVLSHEREQIQAAIRASLASVPAPDSAA